MGFHSYTSFKGSKTGGLKGESSKPKRSDNWFDIDSIHMSTEAPRTSNSGNPKGARRHKTITLTREVDAASPLLFKACWSNEIFPEVVLEVTAGEKSGHERVVWRTVLTDAVIAHVKPHYGHATKATKKMESVSLVFRNISVTNLPPNTSTTDDWNANSQ